MSGIPTSEVQNILSALLGTTAYTTPTGRKTKLLTANASDTAGGTEVTGGSYPAGGVATTFTNPTSTSRQIASTADISFTGMPAATVTGIDITDSAGSRRLAYGPLAASKTVDAGDTLTFVAGSIVLSIT